MMYITVHGDLIYRKGCNDYRMYILSVSAFYDTYRPDGTFILVEDE